MLKPRRFKGLYGGRGGMKSHFFAELMIEAHLNPGERSICVREVQNSMEDSVKMLLEDKIRKFGLTERDGFVIKHDYIRTPGDGKIIFEGMRNHTKDTLKSLEGFRRAWVEEAQSLSKRSLEILTPTIRWERKDPLTGEVLEISELWFSWNPHLPSDPVDQLFRGPNPHPDAIAIEISYKDNPWFPEVLRRDMEWARQTDPDKYQHVWAGGYETHNDTRVFKNFRVESFETPANAMFYLGADWGFSVDPSTLVRCFVQDVDPVTKQPYERRRLYIDRDLWKIGVEIDHLPAFFDGLVCGCKIQDDGSPQPEPCRDPSNHGWAREWACAADSARPETISYLNRNDYPRIAAAKKGPNSVKEGVIFLQGFDIVIHPRCTHTIDEFISYSYKKDPRTGIIYPILEDKKNHVIDPLRYSLEQLHEAGTTEYVPEGVGAGHSYWSGVAEPQGQEVSY